MHGTCKFHSIFCRILEVRGEEIDAKTTRVLNDYSDEFTTYFRNHTSEKSLFEIKKTYIQSFEITLSSKGQHNKTLLMMQFKPILSIMIDNVYLTSFDSKDSNSEKSRKIGTLIDKIRSNFSHFENRDDRASELYRMIREANSGEYIALKKELLQLDCTVEEFETKFKTMLTRATNSRFCRYLMRDTMKLEAILM